MRRFLVAVVGMLEMVVAASTAAPAAAPGPDWLVVVAHSARSDGDTAMLRVTTRDEIPVAPNRYIRSNLGAGFAWADLSTGKVFAMTIHPTLGVDSVQNPLGWHAHAVSLAGGATAPNDFCIKSVDSAPFVRFSIENERMSVRVAQSGLPEPVGRLKAAAGFTIEHDSACASTLAVRLSTGSGGGD